MMQTSRLAAIVLAPLALIGLSITPSARADSGITWLPFGPLPGLVWGGASVSGDGNAFSFTVDISTPSSSSPLFASLTYSPSTGIQSLSPLPGDTSFWGGPMSTTGSVLVGSSGQGELARRATRWTAAGGLQDLGVLPGESYSQSASASADASIIVGRSGNHGTYHSSAFRWSQTDGMAALPMPAGATESTALGVSRNGRAIVGTLGPSGPTSVLPVKWTDAGPPVTLPVNAYWTFTQPAMVNDTGDVIIGTSQFGGATNIVRWNADGTRSELPFLPGGTPPNGIGFAIPASMTPDGNTIVGWSDSNFGWHAALWQGNSVFDLNQWLPSVGVPLNGAELIAAYGISDDGQTLVGRGTIGGVQRFWIATIPVPTTVAGAFTFAGAGAFRRRRSSPL